MTGLVLDVRPDATPGTTWVYFRGGAHPFDVEADAFAFVARRQLADPALTVEVRVR